jgi:hypothetical protein
MLEETGTPYTENIIRTRDDMSRYSILESQCPIMFTLECLCTLNFENSARLRSSGKLLYNQVQVRGDRSCIQKSVRVSASERSICLQPVRCELPQVPGGGLEDPAYHPRLRIRIFTSLSLGSRCPVCARTC